MNPVFFLSLMNGAAWGGSEELWYCTALWMAKHGYKVGIGCYDWEEKKHRIEELKKNGCNIYLLPNRKGLFKKAAIKKALLSIPFDEYALTVVNQGGWEEILHAPFKNLYKRLAKYVIVNHNYNQNAFLSFKKQQLLQQWILKAQMNFGATEKIFEMIESKFNIHINKKATLINPITFYPDTQANPYPVFTNDTCIWIMLAELDVARKAQNILIETLSSTKWKNRNWQLHLYGKGKDKEMLEKLIHELGLDDKIFLKGFKANSKQILQNCHLLLQCTFIDAMPLSVVEAMAMARPCVVSNVGDMPAWIKDDINGFVCSAVSKEGVDVTLEACWQKKDSWQKMGEMAFKTFQQNAIHH